MNNIGIIRKIVKEILETEEISAPVNEKLKTVLNLSEQIMTEEDKKLYLPLCSAPMFTSPEKIPSLPVFNSKEFYDIYVVPMLVKKGAIKKSDLELGASYIGRCRNSREATWDGSMFVYEREKFGSRFEEKICHFEDSMVNDVFIPIKKI